MPLRPCTRDLWVWVWAVFILTAFGVPARAGDTLTYADGETALEGYLALPAGADTSVPGVLVVHQWLGVTDHEKEVADRLAGEGYAAFACDIYGKDTRPAGPSEAGTFAGRYKGDIPLYRQRLARGLDVLRSRREVDGTRIAVIGYCFGGTGALELARSGADIRAAVSFHGGLSTPNPEDARRIKGTILVCHGGNDAAVPDEELMAFFQEMRAAGLDWYLMVFGNAVHGFTHRHDDRRYDEKAEARSWEAMLDLFREVFNR